MAKHKKKPGNYSKQKIAKAQHRKEFFKKIKYICDACGGKGTFDSFSQEIKDDIYIIRFHTLKIIADPDNDIPNEILNRARHMLPLIFKGTRVDYFPNAPAIPLEDYFTVGMTLMSLYESHENERDDPKYRKLMETPHIDIHKEPFFFNAVVRLISCLVTFIMQYIEIGKKIYWIESSYFKRESKNTLDNLLTIKLTIPGEMVISIDGVNRTVFRLTLPCIKNHLFNFSIKYSQLRATNFQSDCTIDVYIQKHALDRFYERIDCLFKGTMHVNLYKSFFEPVIVNIGNDRFLLEYRIHEMKAGYFLAEIIDGILVIRTFLFITNDSTPEGQLLQKNTGLSKLDKKYLAIDKLSTFMSSDIANNKEIADIFRNAGCQSLLHLYTKVKLMCTKTPNESVVMMLSQYLHTSESVKSEEAALQEG